MKRARDKDADSPLRASKRKRAREEDANYLPGTCPCSPDGRCPWEAAAERLLFGPAFRPLSDVEQTLYSEEEVCRARGPLERGPAYGAVRELLTHLCKPYLSASLRVDYWVHLAEPAIAAHIGRLEELLRDADANDFCKRLVLERSHCPVYFVYNVLCRRDFIEGSPLMLRLSRLWGAYAACAMYRRWRQYFCEHHTAPPARAIVTREELEHLANAGAVRYDMLPLWPITDGLPSRRKAFKQSALGQCLPRELRRWIFFWVQLAECDAAAAQWVAAAREESPA